MIKNIKYDVAVIGAGAAGLAAGSVCGKNNLRTIIIDRESFAGGILRQCIHNGFGLEYFKEELTGPEYATRVNLKAKESNVDFALNTAVHKITKLDNGTFELLNYSPKTGVTKIAAKAIMLAMGCRERNRGNISTPGSRPAGIYTAGAAQKLINMKGLLPGKSAVIVGSGDIGLIMARRLQWSGIEVKGVVEIMPQPSGLTRNVVQCLHDFNIPLYLEHSVTNIIGNERVERIEVSPLVDGVPNLDKTFIIDCDTLLFSVGLVPENELSREIGVEINPATGGAFVSSNFETNIPGVFAGGNVLHVHDLVDSVSEESTLAGEAIVQYINDQKKKTQYKITTGANLSYIVPNYFEADKSTDFYMRSLISCDRAKLQAIQNNEVLWEKSLTFIRPAEMIKIKYKPQLGNFEFKLKAES